MDQTIKDILEFVYENDIKFIRLQFCDIFGNLKNISIMSSELEKAFVHGISFDASSIKGFLNVEESDLFLFPDPTTLAILPWRPEHERVARFFCNIKRGDGSDFEGDSRKILKRATDALWNLGFKAKIGPECEFYIFKTDDEGDPILTPQDEAGYLDIAPLDKGENIRREVCLTLEQMGLKPETSHHESGPGQNEIDIKYDEPLASADNFITLKTAIKTICNLNGLYASFMPKPFIKESGSGFHINLSLVNKAGQNIFTNGEEHSKEAESFIEGVINRIGEITAILNPTVNSYKRFGGFEAPTYISWSHKNRSQLIRIPEATGEFSRMELRSPDCTCNPYLAFALVIYAGIEGIREGKKLSKPNNTNLYEYQLDNNQVDTLNKLPLTLKESIKIYEESDFIKDILGEFVYEKFLMSKKEEWNFYEISCKSKEGITDWEVENYFYRL